MTAALQVQNLRTHYFTRRGVVKAVDDVSFSVPAGRILGLVGESGSGKSVAGCSIVGLVDPPGRIVGGRILFEGRDLRALCVRDMRNIRGNRIAVIFQDPLAALNPVLRIGTQMTEAILAHHKLDRRRALERACAGLARVGIAAPERRLRAYPHQLSGGTRQRVAIAIALLNRPALVVADEPTTALDPTIQGQILHQVQQLCRESGTALLWISHDLSVVSGIADAVCVMYAGRIVEQGSVDAVLRTPKHPYTRGLIESVPGRTPHGTPLAPIRGAPPSPLALPPGCAFSSRCDRADAACTREPELLDSGNGHCVRCFHPFGGRPGEPI